MTKRKKIDDNPVYRKALEFVIQYKISHGGDSPIVRDLMSAIGNRSTSYTRWILTKLVEVGELEEVNFAPRAIVVKNMQIVYPTKLSEKYPEEGETVLARWNSDKEFIPAAWYWKNFDHDEHEVCLYRSWKFLDLITWKVCLSDNEPVEWILLRSSLKGKENVNNISL